MSEDPEKAVALLIDTHRARLLNIVDKKLPAVLLKRLSAEDILQIVFRRAVPKYQRLTKDLDHPDFGWLYRIVMDVMSEEWTRATRRCRDIRHDVQLPEGSHMSFIPVTSVTGPVSAAIRNELKEAVSLVLSQLKEEYRFVLIMRTIDELTFNEMASVLDITSVNAARRFYRANEAFKKVWKQQYPDWSVA